jgi:hypothetical protein
MFCPVLLLHPVYWTILTMHGPINVKSPNDTSKLQMEFNSAFKGLKPSVKGTVFPHVLQLSRGYSTLGLVRYHGNMPKEM